MTDAREPVDGQAVEQHGDRCGPQDGQAAPSLRLLEAEVALGAGVGVLDGPTLGVADEDVFAGLLDGRRREEGWMSLRGATKSAPRGAFLFGDCEPWFTCC